MSEERIKELQEFVDDFKSKLKTAKDQYELSKSKSLIVDEEEKKLSKTHNNISPKTSPRRIKHKILTVKIFFI